MNRNPSPSASTNEGHGQGKRTTKAKDFRDENLEVVKTVSLQTFEGTDCNENSLETDLPAARIVSRSIANAALLLKKQAHKKSLRLEAKVIAWRSIANAALENRA